MVPHTHTHRPRLVPRLAHSQKSLEQWLQVPEHDPSAMYGYATAIYRLYTGYSPTMRQLYHRQWWLQVPGERIKILLQTQGQGGAEAIDEHGQQR